MSYVKSFLILTIVIAALSLIAWKQQAPATDSVLEKLIGKWNWVRTQGGVNSTSYTPATIKYNQMVEFNKRGMYKRYKDGKVLVENSFIITIDSSMRSAPKTYWLKNVGHYSQAITFRGADTLVLTDECDHCYINTYVKQK